MQQGLYATDMPSLLHMASSPAIVTSYVFLLIFLRLGGTGRNINKACLCKGIGTAGFVLVNILPCIKTGEKFNVLIMAYVFSITSAVFLSYDKS